jgi:hypothetical protein
MRRNLKERDYLEDLGVDGKVQVKCTLKKTRYRAWIGLIWLRIGTTGSLLRENVMKLQVP